MKPPRAFDFLGNIAIVNFPKGFRQSKKKKYAQELMQKNKSITTILEKAGKVSGRLRKPKLKHVAGKKTKEVLYKENNCVFRFNVDTTYFSPRLSNERKEIASKIKKGEKVLVIFAGVSPYSIVIAKNSKAEKIYSNEINREANKYAKLNIELNTVKDKVELIPGDIKKVVKKLDSLRSQIDKKLLMQKNSKKSMQLTVSQQKTTNFSLVNSNQSSHQRANLPKFDAIIMPRPQLKDTFLEQAFKLSRRRTKIYYYDFCKVDEEKLIVEKIKKEALRAKKRIKILKIKKAGEIAPYKIRIRIDFRVL
ncbi:hypothetical protein CMI44_00720 [Candidatus Pacearchaeota archaeon]|nr:hypothetical protein [Candidatus Pacearchaeota archaeon]